MNDCYSQEFEQKKGKANKLILEKGKHFRNKIKVLTEVPGTTTNKNEIRQERNGL